MPVLTLGLNHEVAPLAMREQAAFGPEDMTPALRSLRQVLADAMQGAAIVSTCNRTELYCEVSQITPVHEQAVRQWLMHNRSLHTHMSERKLVEHLYVHREQDAVRHALRVASGLDSMVLGEPQILGQMKDAARLAREAGSLGPTLDRLFQHTFSVAKDVRTNTAINDQSVSLAAVAVRVAQRIFGDLSQSSILFVGAGEMIELAAAHFAAQHPARIAVANRTVERAQRLAHKVQGEAMPLRDLPERFASFDIIISCTASSLPIIGQGMVERALRARKRKPMLMFDLAVPRDIEPEIAQIRDVYLYTVDDLGALSAQASNARRAAVSQAEQIIEGGVQQFMHWVASRKLVPVIQQARQQADTVRQQELEHAAKLLAKGQDPLQVLQAFSQALTAKFMHGPLAALQDLPTEQRQQLLALLPRLLPIPSARADAEHSTTDLHDSAQQRER